MKNNTIYTTLINTTMWLKLKKKKKKEQNITTKKENERNTTKNYQGKYDKRAK